MQRWTAKKRNPLSFPIIKLSQCLVPPHHKKINTYKELQAEHSTFRCAAYHEAESGTTTTKPINKHQSIGVPVRWPGKKAEHSFFLDFFVSFCIKAKRKTIISGSWSETTATHKKKKTKNALTDRENVRHLVPRCDKTPII